MATKKKPGTAVAKWDERLAQYAKKAEATTGVSTGQFLSVRGGVLTFDGSEIPDGVLNMIVLDHVFENHFYSTRYDSDNPTPPDCFAFGRGKEGAEDYLELKPHDDATAPVAPTCAECPNNVFGTADTGKGKACGNSRRLAIITPDMLEDGKAVEVAYLKVPVTSCRAWDGYVKELSRLKNRPPFAVITEMTVVPDAKTQVKVSFRYVESIDDDAMLEKLVELHEKAKTETAFPYTPASDAPAQPRGRAAPRPAARPAARTAPRPATKAAPASKVAVNRDVKSPAAKPAPNAKFAGTRPRGK